VVKLTARINADNKSPEQTLIDLLNLGIYGAKIVEMPLEGT